LRSKENFARGCKWQSPKVISAESEEDVTQEKDERKAVGNSVMGGEDEDAVRRLMNTLSRQGQEGNLLALHPTVKPVTLVADALLDCTAPGELVLDSFLGSGSTLIAAERTGRVCRGIELDPLYVDTVIRRWQRYTGGTAIHAESGRDFGEEEVARG
jgi:DNA modification methylase